MSSRAKSATADEIARIEELIGDLEKRLQRLSTTTRNEVSGGAGDINDFVSAALARIMKRVRDNADTLTDTVADKATRVTGDAIERVVEEVESHPVAMLAAAAGIGYLIGLSRR